MARTNPPLRPPEEPALRHAAFSPVRPVSNVDHTEVPEDTLLWKPLTGHWLQQPQDTRPPFRGPTPPHIPSPSTTQAPCSLTGPLGYCRSPPPSQAHPPPRRPLATPTQLSESPQCGPSLPGLPGLVLLISPAAFLNIFRAHTSTPASQTAASHYPKHSPTPDLAEKAPAL